MIYILIFVVASNSYPVATTTTEFNTKEACTAAAEELKRQAALTRGGNYSIHAPIIFCAAKGKPA